MRHRVALLAAAAVAACAAGCRRGPAAPAARPNVVLITLDTTRADHLSLCGYGKETAPHLGRLAAEGVVFRDFVNVSSWTLPSHASLFTGLYPVTHTAHYSRGGELALSSVLGKRGNYPFFRANRLPEEAVTLAEVLRGHGYDTFGIGSGPWLAPVFGLAQGFEEYDCDIDSTRGRTGDEVNRLALPFLRRPHGERPFFLFLNYFDPHDPYAPPEHLERRFEEGGENASPRPPLRRALARYDGEIFFMDRCIGEILDEMRARGLYDTSWIVVTADHGEHFGEHGLGMHGFSLFEPVVRGVLVVKPPAVSGWGPDPSERCQQVDVMPTLLAALGIAADSSPPPPPMEGEPLGRVTHPAVCELFENEGNVRWRGKRFARSLRAIRAGSDKLIVSTRPNDRDAGLFDLASDPGETRDLSASRPDRVRELRAALASWERSLAPPLRASPVESVDRKTLERLRGLGYMEQGAGSGGGGRDQGR